MTLCTIAATDERSQVATMHRSEEAEIAVPDDRKPPHPRKNKKTRIKIQTVGLKHDAREYKINGIKLDAAVC